MEYDRWQGSAICNVLVMLTRSCIATYVEAYYNCVSYRTSKFRTGPTTWVRWRRSKYCSSVLWTVWRSWLQQGTSWVQWMRGCETLCVVVREGMLCFFIGLILVIVGVLRHILVHSEAYRGSLSSSFAELLELETISICWDIGLLSMPITSACIHSDWSCDSVHYLKKKTSRDASNLVESLWVVETLLLLVKLGSSRRKPSCLATFLPQPCNQGRPSARWP